jgi:transcriptional regulator with XRE-family HTH domain
MKKRMTELRATRTARGLTLKELAAKVSMSYSRIQQGDWDLSTARPITQLFISRALKDRKFQLWPEQDRADLRRLRTALMREQEKEK